MTSQNIAHIAVQRWKVGEVGMSEFILVAKTDEETAFCRQYSNMKELVRCKDCKHRPKKPDWETYEDGGDIEFPDGKCPCQCSSDRYYSWYPDDDWFCADGERK